MRPGVGDPFCRVLSPKSTLYITRQRFTFVYTSGVDATLEREALLSLDDVAQTLGVSVATVRRMVDRHELVAVQLGGHSGRPWRIPSASLNAALRGWEARG